MGLSLRNTKKLDSESLAMGLRFAGRVYAASFSSMNLFVLTAARRVDFGYKSITFFRALILSCMANRLNDD